MNINLRRLTFVLGILFLGISIFINSPAPVRAATITVDIDTDDNLATLDQVGNGPCSLREAINNAINDAALSDDCPAGAGDDIIEFDSASYTIVISNNVSAGAISVSTNITINGDVTLDGNNQNNIFVMSGTGDIVLDNITFINGNNSAGGAILVNSPSTNLTITDSDFDGNNADGNGGAISSSGQLSIFDTIFRNNTADVEGGAIHQSSSSPMTITSSGFMNNTAGVNNDGRGGAIYHNEGSLLVSTITASYFDDNTASNADSADGGGAIFHNGGQLLITASVFSGNTADGTDARGGAIFNNSSDDFALEINYSHFGETLSFPLPLPAPLDVLSLTAGNSVTGTTANTSGGGAIYNFGSMEITAVSFIGNTSSSHGGAIFNQATTDDDGIFDGDEVVIANTTFHDNTATGDGGAFYNEFGAEDDLVSFQNVTIADNTAANGDAIFNEGDGESIGVSQFDDISIVNSIIANNDCAGGELGNGNMTASGNNVVFNSTCIIVQQDGSSTAATPITTDPMLQAPFLEFSLGALVTFPMEIGAGSSASGTGDAAACSAFPVIDLDQRGLPLGTRPQGDPICDIGAYESDQVAPAPEIDVLGNAISIADGDNTPDVADDTDFGITTIGTPITNTFTIANTGTASLTITTPLGNSDAVNFTLTDPLGTVAAGGSTTFDVTCNALSINTFTATITITNNDADENPYTFDVICQVDGIPEIDVLGNAVSIVDGDNTPSVTDDTDFGSTTVGTAISSIFTIENTGSADLTGINVTVPAGFTLVTPPIGTITAGNSDNFTIECDAASANTFTGTVSIANNDSDENPYTFDITCQVTAVPEPEIDVLGNGNSINDGDNTPSVTDDTDFGTTPVGTPVTNTFTIANTGTADLTITTPLGNSDAVNFTLTDPAGTVSAATNTTFDVTCNALSAGTFTATITIVNDDTDENPYTFDVTCDVTGTPEIDVLGNALSIADGDNTPDVADDTDFGSTTVGNPISNVFTIENTGTGSLTGINVTVPFGFTLSIAPAVTVAAGANTTFTVECDALVASPYTGTASIANSDSDENPYTFDISCNVTGTPEMDVLGNGNSITDGDNTPSATDDTDFGSTPIGTPVTNTFTVANTGTADLTPSTATLTDPVNFSVTVMASPVGAGASTTFDITCNALSVATFTTTVSIANNDADENPYTFDVTCNVTAAPEPEMDVLGNGNSITDGDNTPSATDDTDFGSTPIGTPVTNTFTVANTGTADLTPSTATLTDPVNFSVTVMASPVGAGASTTFDITCNALSVATFTTTVSIANNDADENPYTFDVTCNVTAAPEPEMDVQGNGNSITDGDNTPAAADDTDFGSTPIGTPVTNTFTVENLGSADLTPSTATLTDPVNFSVTVMASPVGAGASTTFDITCNALSVATFTTTVSIANNDADENPYTFDVTCDVTALAPEINIVGNGNSIADGDNTPAVADDTDFGSTPVGTPITNTFTVANTGTADLTPSTATLTDPVNFSVTVMASPVGAGASTTFDVTCNALSVNTFTTTVSIANNDADENPYTFDVTCDVTALAPEMDVLGNGNSIADGDNTPAVADDTDFGSTPVGTPITNTFTVANTGNADLTPSTATLTDPVNFSVTVMASPVGAGASTTFDITCNALSVGTFTSTVSIANNDADENPYTFDVTCDVTALAPEINIVGNGNNILDGDNTPSAADDTDLGSTAVGAAVSSTFTLENTGTSDLTLSNPTLTDAVNFTVTGLPSPVGAGANTTFDVTCNALSVGTFTTTVSIANNDADENPYTFDVTCNVTLVAEPEMDVQGNGLSIADGDNTPSVADSTDFGATVIGSTLSITYTIENLGAADLNIGVLTVPAGFTVTTAPAVTVPAGTTTTFTVECDAAAVATFSGTVSIANDDTDENPYTFDISCDVVAAGTPGYTSAPFAPAATINFGNVPVGNFTDLTLTISENGTADLDIYTVAVTGAGFSIQSVTPPVFFTIVDNSGDTVVVVLRCSPTAAGTINGTLTVTHNATGQSTDYPLVCNGTTGSTTGGGSMTGSSTAINVFDPAISKIGFLLPGQVGVTGETLRWDVTVSNVGGAAGTNVTITDTLIPQLSIIRVEAPGGTVTISEQTVTVVYPTLAVGQTVNFSIFTLVTDGLDVNNTACVVTPNECATTSLVSELPSTGENPWWYWPLLGLIVGLVGMSIFGLRRALRKA